MINGKAKVISFIDSTSIVIKYSSDIVGLDFIKHISDIDKGIDEKIFKDYFNKHNISTNYNLVKHVFNFTPDDVKWYDSNKDVLVRYSLMRFKELIMAKGYKDYLNNFETEHIKGFQFGNPEYSKRGLS